MGTLQSKLATFFQSKTAPGIVLCISAILALVFVNSPLSKIYNLFLDVPVMVKIGGFSIDKPLLLWINDGLMAIFFLLIGLEIKREILEGHLSDKEFVILPTVAALGGLTVPALIYLSMTWGNDTMVNGWAIPAATDIAFALGVMILLGDKVPPALKVCLVAIAIIDDLAAIVIIALFYTAETSVVSLLLGGVCLGITVVMNRKGVKSLGPYMIVGLIMWACVLKSGVHATLAGVALGLIIPLKGNDDSEQSSPLKNLEHTLHPFVSFVVLPVFAFANAGVSLIGLEASVLFSPITLGIMLGLFFGKQIGVMLFSYLIVTLKFCRLPDGTSWLQYYGMALLTGIGFTMSLFIGSLAFSDPAHITAVRLGVLSGSFLSGIVGVMVLVKAAKLGQAKGAAPAQA